GRHPAGRQPRPHPGPDPVPVAGRHARPRRRVQRPGRGAARAPRPGREHPRRRRRAPPPAGGPTVTGRRRLRRFLAAGLCATTPLALGGCGLVGGGQDTMTVTAIFDSAVGVYETGDVLVLDRPVGTIEAVELDGDHVRVDLRLRRDVPLPADVHATIEAQTVLGERSVTLFPSWNAELEARSAPRLADGDIIPLARTAVPVEPDEALQTFNELLSNLDPHAVGGLVTDGAQILDGRGERLGASIDAVADLSETLAAVDGPMLRTAESLNRIASVLN